MKHIEHINWNGKQLACIIRSDMNPEETNFLTPKEYNLQVGFVVHPKGGEIVRHIHRSLERQIVGTSEVLIVKRGRCKIDIYNDELELVTTKELRAGDVVVLFNGGHGFRMEEDTVFLEIKQGPYIGQDEKIRF